MRLKPRMTRSVDGEIWRPVVLGSGFSPHGYYCQLTSENGHGHQKQTTEGYGGNGNSTQVNCERHRGRPDR